MSSVMEVRREVIAVVTAIFVIWYCEVVCWVIGEFDGGGCGCGCGVDCNWSVSANVDGKVW